MNLGLSPGFAMALGFTGRSDGWAGSGIIHRIWKHFFTLAREAWQEAHRQLGDMIEYHPDE
ncbi:hypothetical protein IV454_12775 [Massilia antarctica]|uniref:Uncharacterized protein n=2 Tax=Massilia antarctica TaxID=2765360 RepID=A0AA48WGG3_9BURK|nr:hypothetical protein IV454_12775 [Massilia antarctica]